MRQYRSACRKTSTLHDESDDDLTDFMRDDEELEEIMESVFGEDSDDEL